MCLFCTYIVYLLSKSSQHGQKHWVIPKKVNINSNCITLKRIDKCEVLFIGYRDMFEVYCQLQYHREIKDELCQAMDEVSNTVKPQRGFYCICKDAEMCHIAFEKGEFCLYCSETNDNYAAEYNCMYSCWSWCTSQFKDKFGKLTLL